MFRNRSVNVHQFAMVPRAEIPRSGFNIQHTHKTTFDSGYLIPVYLEEVVPGDSLRVKMTAFARMSTPIFPLMDNLRLDSFFFFIPNRLVWVNWKKMMGEQIQPGDSIDYTIPQVVSPPGGYAIGSIFDYFGLPTVGQVLPGNTVSHSVLPLRCYNAVYNDWFRDENLQQSAAVAMNDGPDNVASYVLRRRGKRHDYFTSALPWPQKGDPVTLPLGVEAPIKSDGTSILITGSAGALTTIGVTGAAGSPLTNSTATNTGTATFGPPGTASTGLYADLSEATAATINQLRQSFQVQKLLERDARGGTRYTEIVRAHFGVVSPDSRLQRPEYLGGGSTPVTINPIAQTSGTPTPSGYTTTPMGTLAAMGTVLAGGHGFSQSFTEHGHVLGLVCIRGDLTYQQGMARMWNRKTRYDFYFPAFAALGEQTILNKEIYCDGSVNDEGVFGYQERWAEMRYHPSMITGLFRSTAASTIDAWHLAQKFAALPTLNATFIEESPPMQRILAVGAAAAGQEFIFDSFFDVRATRPLPMFSVPGLIDHF